MNGSGTKRRGKRPTDAGGTKRGKRPMNAASATRGKRPMGAAGAKRGERRMIAGGALQEVMAVLRRNRGGEAVGVYSVCSAHPLVLEAAMTQARNDRTPLLVEATANQVNQFGGYTGMRPADFPPYVAGIAKRAGLDPGEVVLGGDHLGPVCWTGETANAAMARSCELVESYVEAGFAKIHLDTSMPCADDPDELDDEVVAMRAARLCRVAERAANGRGGESGPVYVVGTEVPPPGGAKNGIDHLEVTSAERASRTLSVHARAFADRGLGDAWRRVVGLVVQPGVEFGHSSVHRYRADRASALGGALKDWPNLVYEAHSTDYQPAAAYRELLRDHHAILKVGPQLTFALREALFALSAIEHELLDGADRCSRLPEVCDRAMSDRPAHWLDHYPAKGSQARWYRRYSYSDRIRYYWTHPDVAAAVERLLGNLADVEIPLPMLSQFLPAQYKAVRDGKLLPEPNGLVMDRIMEVTSVYSAACRGLA